MLLTLAVQVENLCQSSRCQTVPKAVAARQNSRDKGASSGRSRKVSGERFRHKEKREARRWRISRAAHVEDRSSRLLLATVQALAGVCGHTWKSLRVIPLLAGYSGLVRHSGVGSPSSLCSKVKTP